MPRLKAANNARTVLVQSAGVSDTTIYVQDVSKFPSVPFRITVDAEIMEVTAIDINIKAFTVERAKEGTAAVSHSIGASVENRWTADTYNELAGINDLTWGNIANKPSSFTPAPHKSTHASNGADPIAPSDIGAQPALGYTPVNKAGDTMTGSLTAPKFISTVATGTSPLSVSSTTLVTNLNVDMLDNYHAGNSSGRIPVSNGTVNTNLNADLLDGHDGSYYLPVSSYTASDVLTKIKTVDGEGSGLDADTLRGETPDQLRGFKAGDIPLKAYSGSTVQGSATPNTWELENEIVINNGGTLRIKFGLFIKSGATYTIYGRIYRNGTPVGTLRSLSGTGTSLTTFTEDIGGWLPGDKIQLMVQSTSGSITYSPMGLYVDRLASFQVTI